MDNSKEKTTELLTEVLKTARPSEVDAILERFAAKLSDEDGAFQSYVRALFRQKGLRQQDIFLMADIPERYGYKLISGEKTTQRRDILLRIFLASGFSLDEVQHALRLYGMPMLYPRFPRDAVLMIAINTEIRDPYDADELLTKHGMEPLTPCGSYEK